MLWEKKRLTSHSSSLVMSTQENQPLPVILFTSAVVLKRELSKSSRRKPEKWVKNLSSTHGFSINSRQIEKEVSPSISLFGNSSQRRVSSPLSMLPDIEISSRTRSLVLPKLMLPFS